MWRAVEPASREEMSWVARLKPWSARALLKCVSARCSDRREKASGQPGMFWSLFEAWACSSEWQSVAQRDQRRPAVNPACFERHVWKRNAGDLVRWHVYSEPRRCGAAFCLASLENMACLWAGRCIASVSESVAQASGRALLKQRKKSSVACS